MPVAIPGIHLGDIRDLENHKRLQHRLQGSNGFPLPSPQRQRENHLSVLCVSAVNCEMGK
jgi:hypothetical protein